MGAPVVGFDGLYSVNKYGEVFEDGRELTPINQNGKLLYPMNDLNHQRVYRAAAELVAKAYLQYDADQAEIVYLDGNENNAQLANLKLVPKSPLAEATTEAPVTDKSAPERVSIGNLPGLETVNWDYRVDKQGQLYLKDELVKPITRNGVQFYLLERTDDKPAILKTPGTLVAMAYLSYTPGPSQTLIYKDGDSNHYTIDNLTVQKDGRVPKVDINRRNNRQFNQNEKITYEHNGVKITGLTFEQLLEILTRGLG